MATNTTVIADHNAPAVTHILAEFVAAHPSKGWTDAVDHEAHRTFLNWLGCAIGASDHSAARAALSAVNMLQPAPQASIAGRTERVDVASAALINGTSCCLSPEKLRATNVAPSCSASDAMSIGESLLTTPRLDFDPWSAVAENCPFVKPYTPLFSTI